MKRSPVPATPATLRLRAFAITVAILVAATLTVYGFLTVFRVESIQITGAKLLSEADVLEAIRVKEGTHLYAVNPDKITEKIKAQSPYIKSASVSRKLPKTLIVDIREYTLSYYIEYGEHHYLLTEGLLVLEETTPEKAAAQGACPLFLPKLKDPEKTKDNPDPPKILTPGKTLTFEESANKAWCLSLLTQIEEMSFAENLTQIDLSDPFALELVVENKYRISLGNERSFTKKLVRADRALTYLNKNMYALAGVLYATEDAPVTFTMTGVIEDEAA